MKYFLIESEELPTGRELIITDNNQNEETALARWKSETIVDDFTEMVAESVTISEIEVAVKV